MALYNVSNGNSINALDLNQIVLELQKAAGVTETGNYFLAGNTNQTSGVVSNWISFRSRVSTPVSVSVDTSLQAPTGGIGTSNAGNIQASGFQVYGFVASPPAGNARYGGAYTIQF